MAQDQKPRGKRLKGVKIAADLLNSLDEEHRNRLLADVARQDPRIATEIEKNLRTFESLSRADDAGLQLLIRQISQPTLALALRKASDTLKDTLFRNLSARAVQILKEEIEQLGPQKVSEVEKAQNEILEVAKTLERAGKIIFS